MLEGKLILGIESSCDETSASVVMDGRRVLSNVISSQIELHKKFGGVVPEVASRKHVENISAVVDKAMGDADVTFKQLDSVAVTYGPGLVGALLVGLSYAKGLSFSISKPLIGVHHIEGHICANYLESADYSPPFVCLVVSGGHTNLIMVNGYDDIEVIGKTRDDAAGEAYDKVARALGLSYPGGPAIDSLAGQGSNTIDFPRAYLDNYDFSFSGLKSNVLNYLNKCRMKGIEINKADVAHSFQAAVVEVLVNKAVKLCKERKCPKIALAGGVASNSALRRAMENACNENGFQFKAPKPVFCTDNAAMVASSAYFNHKDGGLSLNAYPNLVLGQKY